MNCCILLLIILFASDHALASKKRKMERKNPKIIVGGEDAKIQDHPYHVGLIMTDPFLCGGSIISEWYILTAAHCVDDVPILYVHTGSSDLYGGGTNYLISNVTVHNTSDVAILRLQEPIEFDKTRQPIQLFNENEEVEIGSIAEVTGWGLTKEKGKNSDKLQVIYVPIVDTNKCNSTYQDIKKDEFCAGFFNEGGRDSCQNDSGGALVINNRQAGIVSAGEGCARPGFPGIYVNIGYVRQWIREITGV